MRGGCVLRAQVYACVISSLCMQILSGDGRGDGVRLEDGGVEAEREGTCAGNGWSERGRGRRREMV